MAHDAIQPEVDCSGSPGQWVLVNSVTRRTLRAYDRGACALAVNQQNATTQMQSCAYVPAAVQGIVNGGCVGPASTLGVLMVI